MKVRIKETGEIVKVESWSELILDKYDSFENPIKVNIDEVEIISEPTIEELKANHALILKPSDMPSEERMRYELAKAAIPTAWSVCVKYDYSTSKYSHIGDKDIAKESLGIADAIIKQLKESEETK